LPIVCTAPDDRWINVKNRNHPAMYRVMDALA
jgi:hypothetical protein